MEGEGSVEDGKNLLGNIEVWTWGFGNEPLATRFRGGAKTSLDFDL